MLRNLGIAGMLACAGLAAGADWPAWRGPTGDGVCTEKRLPTQWSRTENIAWKTPLPEPGNATPILWGDRIFVPQNVKQRRTLMCFARADGKLLWQQGVEWTAKEPTHSTNPYCASSAVTDGERVIVWFGSAGLFCYDFAGKELWRRDLGEQRHIWGYGASPALLGERCYLNFGPGPRAFLLCVDKRTGKDVWRKNLPAETAGTAEAKFQNVDYHGSWSDPLVRRIDGEEQVVLSQPFRVTGYAAADGAERWTCTGLNALVYTTPIGGADMLVSLGGYSGMAIGFRPGGQGDITATRRAWRHPRTKQRIGSGVVHDGHVYIHNDPGIAECFELATGKLVWEHRLGGVPPATGKDQSKGGGRAAGNWSSLLLADGLCYSVNQAGECFVFRASPRFELVAANSLGERCHASVAASAGQLCIRTYQHLWLIGARTAQ